MIYAPSEKSDQPGHLPTLISLLCPQEKNNGTLASHWVHREDSDQTVRMLSEAIWVLAGFIFHFAGYVVLWLKYSSHVTAIWDTILDYLIMSSKASPW